MSDTFISVMLQELIVGEELPVPIYLHIDFRFITYRAAGDRLDRDTYERLELKKLQHVFIREADRRKFQDWSKSTNKAVAPPTKVEAALKPLQKAREDANRKILDIFLSPHPEKEVTQAMEVSKKLVFEVMKLPLTVQSISKLQTYSRGTADHSVNVSILSIYLAMNIGYESAVILQHIGLGALLHDFGKIKVEWKEKDTDAELERKMKEHPSIGARLLPGTSVPNEVKMIIEQHHENYDGSGYPKRRKGSAIYDLARIVSIANVFDELVGDGMGTVQERQRAAVLKIDQEYYRRFDPQKLDKVLKLLKRGI